jgi:hypothetical protein
MDERAQLVHDLYVARDLHRIQLYSLRDRFLRSALDASQATPPQTDVVTQRLKEAIDLINSYFKEIG